jgi:hypothetical protein
MVEIDISVADKLFRGNSIDIGCHVNLDLSDYKIHCEIFDQFYSSIHLDTENVVGGSDDQIEIIDEEDGTFVIHIAKDTTTNFHLFSYIEIDIEDKDGKVQTVWFAPIKFIDNVYIRI